MSRSILKMFIDRKKPVLEIGPLSNPFLRKEQYNVFYADIHDKDQVFEQYCGSSVNYQRYGKSSAEELHESIVPIDYVVNDGYKNSIKDRLFSAVFSSHVIEHTTDLLRHFQDISECLEEGGYLVMAIPDKRFTFDYYRAITPFRDVWDVYNNGQAALSRLAFDYVFEKHSVNNPIDYIENKISFMPMLLETYRIDAALDILKETQEGQWPNAHLWVFTYLSFLELLRDCLRMNSLPYSLAYAESVPHRHHEFYIVLKKNKEIKEKDACRYEQILRIQELIDRENNCTRYVFDTKHIFNIYCMANKPVYLYGAGRISEVVFVMLTELWGCKICGYIVTDGQPRAETKNGLPVIYFSGLKEMPGECLIALALSDYTQIEERLKDLKHHFCNLLTNKLEVSME